MLKNILDSKRCFKLICGAGNEDILQVERLVKLYSMAGCKFFDLSANADVIDAAKRALEDRIGYLCVSVGLKGDPHIRKAQIDADKCKQCKKCEEVCPQRAISYCKVKFRERCIGCGKCFDVCKNAAVNFVEEKSDLRDVLPNLIKKGIDCIELHTMNEDDEESFEKWNYIKNNFEGMLSICTSRGNLSETKMINRIKKMIENRGEYSTIVQADGFPMSGGQDDFKTTLQAVATAEIVQNAKLPVYIMLSGGTNSKTAELAKMCGIDYNGIAIGSFARKIVKDYISRDDFLTNENIFNEALNIAKNLVMSV